MTQILGEPELSTSPLVQKRLVRTTSAVRSHYRLANGRPSSACDLKMMPFRSLLEKASHDRDRNVPGEASGDAVSALFPELSLALQKDKPQPRK